MDGVLEIIRCLVVCFFLNGFGIKVSRVGFKKGEGFFNNIVKVRDKGKEKEKEDFKILESWKFYEYDCF